MTTAFLRRGLPALGLTGLATLVLAVPATARQDPGAPAPTAAPPVAAPVVRVVPVDDNSLEPVQLGIGAVGGALLGAGVLTARRRRRA